MEDNRERRIRERAYDLWEAGGLPIGRELEHWRQAEREVSMSEAGQRDEGEDLESARDYGRKVNGIRRQRARRAGST